PLPVSRLGIEMKTSTTHAVRPETSKPVGARLVRLALKVSAQLVCLRRLFRTNIVGPSADPGSRRPFPGCPEARPAKRAACCFWSSKRLLRASCPPDLEDDAHRGGASVRGPGIQQ